MELKTVGWIGTGVMGKSMCGHLIAAGYAANVFNRSPEKTESLVAAGATRCASPAEVAQKSDIIFTIVGFPSDVEEVYLGENGIINNARKGSVLVDMTTSKPALAQRIAAEAEKKGLFALDAPVSGGDLGARNAALAIMVGGQQDVFDRVQPFFNAMGKTIQLMGPAGAGQHTKMCNQILIAGTMIGVVESLLYAAKAGMDIDAVIDVIGSGAASSWSINNLGRRIAKGDYDPGFFIKHFIKDMGIALEEAKAMQLSLPGLSLVHQLYIAAQAQGLEDCGTQGLYRACMTVNGLK